MTTFFLCALLLCNVFMVGVLLARPSQSSGNDKEEEQPSVSDDTVREEDNDIVKIVKVAVKETVPEVLKVMGRFAMQTLPTLRRPGMLMMNTLR